MLTSGNETNDLIHESTAEIDERGEKPLNDILKEVGGWPVLLGDDWKESEFDWVRTVRTLENIGLSASDSLLEVGMSVDYRNNTRYVVSVSDH